MTHGVVDESFELDDCAIGTLGVWGYRCSLRSEFWQYSALCLESHYRRFDPHDCWRSGGTPSAPARVTQAVGCLD
jgi:hypothetical protein